MNRYIVITTDGNTEDNNGVDTNNCQELGLYDAKTMEDALEQAYNRWATSFEKDTLIAYQIVK